MKTATQTDILASAFGFDEAIRIIAQSGFDYIDLSMFDMAGEESPWLKDDAAGLARHLRNVAEENGIEFFQAHAPFPSSNGDETFDTERKARIEKSIELAAIAGVRRIVVHPVQHLPYISSREELYRMNLDFYRSLIPLCKRCNIQVCTENMWQWDNRRNIIVDSTLSCPEEFNSILDEIGSEWITGCLDIGHTALVGQDPAEFIRKMGARRLQALHVHDVDYLHDCHSLPFTRNLDWDSITGALAEIGYEGVFTFEADNFLARFPDVLKRDAALLMGRTCRYLADKAAGK